MRNSYLLSQNWHFLKCNSNCSTNKHKLLTHKVIKAATDCSYIYCEGNMAKCYKHALFSSNALLSSRVLKSQLTFLHKRTKQNKPCVYYKLQQNIPDMRKHSTMICEIPNDFFLLDGKNTQLSKVVNTWTFDRLTPMVMRVLEWR